MRSSECSAYAHLPTPATSSGQGLIVYIVPLDLQASLYTPLIDLDPDRGHPQSSLGAKHGILCLLFLITFKFDSGISIKLRFGSADLGMTGNSLLNMT